MKWISYLCSALCLFAVQSAIAAVPVTMSGPSPAIAGSYNAGDANTFTYTITNNVPNKSFPITASGISNPVSRTTVSNDCGSTLPKGPSICNIGILIAPQASDAGKTFNQILSVNYQGRIPLTSNLAFSTGTVTTAILTASGQDDTGTAPPLLVVSTNSGNTWIVKSVTGLTINGTFSGSSCTGSGSAAICITAGQDSTGSTPPLLAVSTDGGNNWATKSVTGLPVSGFFLGTSCTGSGSTAVCTAVGEGNPDPLIAVSTDGGNNWAVKPVTGLPAIGIFVGASCTGSGSSAVCAAAGYDGIVTTPILAVSTDGGNTWIKKSVTGIPVSANFRATSCTGNGSSAICTAVGQDTTGTAIVAVSTDGGNTWAIKPVPGLTIGGIFFGTSCIGSESSAICIATGQDGTGVPLVAVSTDGGNTWAVKSVTGLPVSGFLIAASCSGSGPAAVCTAAGTDGTGSEPPLLIVSTDGANTWAVRSVLGLPASGIFRTTICTGSGSTAICTAAGQDYTGSTPPLLALSTDGGNTWAVKFVSAFPASGVFNGTSAASGGQGFANLFDQPKFGAGKVLESLIHPVRKGIKFN